MIGDVKYVEKLSYTAQLQDYMAYAERYAYTFVLYVKPETVLREPLKRLIEQGKIILLFITE